MAKQFESHLYGIETVLKACLQLTMLCLNRTFMELKLKLFEGCGGTCVFESHLYGIETQARHHGCTTDAPFESHLYGIETWDFYNYDGSENGLNRTFMELKLNVLVEIVLTKSV